jgi:hypothetical protein
LVKPWHRYTLTIVLGLAAGASLAVYRVRGGLAAGQVTNGPWATAKTYGSTDADALTRARVALSGLLALPAKEAMYFTAKTDSAGRVLEGKCSYMVRGKPLPTRWWSATIYDERGRLIANDIAEWSVSSAQYVGPNGNNRWLTDDGRWVFVMLPAFDNEYLLVSPQIPIGPVQRFEVTLRLYHPSPELLARPEAAKLPVIERLSC